MSQTCHEIELRLAADEADASVAAHVAACPRCAALARARDGLVGALAARTPAAPAPGFDARVPALAAARLGRRRRLWIGAGLAAATAAALLIAVAPRRPAPAPLPEATSPARVDPGVETAAAELVAFAHEFDAASPSWELFDGPRVSWESVEEPLAAYAFLIDF